MSSLRAWVDAELQSLPRGPIAIAFSGGLDSSVLLHCLAASAEARKRGLRAIHVNHQLHADSDAWAVHCVKICNSSDVPLQTLPVRVDRGQGRGLEASARDARHAAIQSAMRREEIIAFAHHRDDQAETVLLRLLRGAGPEGMAAMRSLRAFGPGQAWRPLLAHPRSELVAHANEFQLEWLEDPSNRDTRIDRNFLRERAIPLLRERWPNLQSTFSQSAQWMRGAADFIEQQSDIALATLRGPDPASLHASGWLALADALRDPVLRSWLRDLGLPPPNRHQVGELERQLREARADRLPCVRWPGVELRRYRQWIHAIAPMPRVPANWQQTWNGNALALPADLGTLVLVDERDKAITLPDADHLQVRFRRGGERIRLRDEPIHHELRDLLQQAGVPPWSRDRMPLVFHADGRMLAVADRWIGHFGCQLLALHDARLVWKTR